MAFLVVAWATCQDMILTQAASSGDPVPWCRRAGKSRLVVWVRLAACFFYHERARAKAMDYRFRIFEGADGQTYVTIQHANGQALYTSEGYKTRKAAIETLENFLEVVGGARLFFYPQDLVARYTVSSTEVQS
jgi:uncharacterized protein YegP (UPF0339 family)